MAVKEAFLGLSLHKTKDLIGYSFKMNKSLFFHSLFWSSVLNTHRHSHSGSLWHK